MLQTGIAKAQAAGDWHAAAEMEQLLRITGLSAIVVGNDGSKVRGELETAAYGCHHAYNSRIGIKSQDGLPYRRDSTDTSTRG